MSSPTQLSQPLECNDDDILAFGNNPCNGNGIPENQPENSMISLSNTDMNDANLNFTQDFDDSDLLDISSGMIINDKFGMNNRSWEESFPEMQGETNTGELVGVETLRLSPNLSSCMMNVSNINLNQVPTHRTHKSSNSIASISNKPPSTLTHSHSIESIPQLSSSISNQSLSDSPSSFQKQQTYQTNQVYNTATPRRSGRNKSLSISSGTMYTTPMRGGLQQQSPINLANLPLKVGKTPHSIKKGHIRSRSRVSVDLQANTHLNPFYTPNTFISPRRDDDNDMDDSQSNDLVTPLPTPNNQPMRSNSYQQMSGGLFSPAMNQNLSSITPISAKNPVFNTTSTTPFSLKRNDTLESIKIEDQDDDAFKQLKKAKSYSSMPTQNPTKMLIRHASQIHVPGEVEKDEKFLSAADLSLRLASHLATEELQNPSSQSTLGGFYDENSPQFNIGGNIPEPYLQQSSQAGVQQHFQQRQQQHQQQLQKQFAPPNSAPLIKPGGIDLLLGEFNSQTDFDGNVERFSKSLVKNLNQSTITNSFTKSYPASIDLASMTTSPLDSSLSAPPTFKSSLSRESSSTGFNTPGLLPPMATFSVKQLIQEQELELLKRKTEETVPMAKSVQDALMAPNFNVDIPIVKSNRMDKTDQINPKKKHRCPICDSRFQRPEHVKRHLKSHSSEKPFQCDEPNCGKRFNRKDNLKAHLKKIHHRKL